MAARKESRTMQSNRDLFAQWLENRTRPRKGQSHRFPTEGGYIELRQAQVTSSAGGRTVIDMRGKDSAGTVLGAVISFEAVDSPTPGQIIVTARCAHPAAEAYFQELLREIEAFRPQSADQATRPREATGGTTLSEQQIGQLLAMLSQTASATGRIAAQYKAGCPSDESLILETSAMAFAHWLAEYTRRVSPRSFPIENGRVEILPAAAPDVVTGPTKIALPGVYFHLAPQTEAGEIGKVVPTVILFTLVPLASERVEVTAECHGAAAAKYFQELLAEIKQRWPPKRMGQQSPVAVALMQDALPPPNSILIVTVTKVETQAVHKAFSQAGDRVWTRMVIGKKTYYDLGVHGGAQVLMVQSGMGTATPGGALLTVRQAIQDLRPQAVIMCGVAFGLHPDKQELGDILIAERLQCYEPQKVDLQRGPILRGERGSCAALLLDRFRSGDHDWKGPPTHFGLVLSGEKLINDPTFRDWLLTIEPEAIGGEMEGAGLYAAARDAGVDWILVKAICDWADGTKNDKAQPRAARNAARFVAHVLQLGGWR